MSRVAVRFVAWSLSLSVVCAGAYLLLFPLPIMVDMPTPAVSNWLIDHTPGWIYGILTRLLSSVAIYSFFAAMTVALVAGPRALRARLPRRGAALTAGGLLLAGLYCGGPMLYYARSRRSFDATAAAAKVWRAEMRDRLESGSVPGPHREKLWQLYAQDMYKEEGVRVEIPDASGGRVLYEPTESDHAVRSFHLKLVSMSPPIDQLKASGVWVGLCLAVGLLTPLRWPRKPAGAPGNQGGNPGTGTLQEE